MQFAGFMMMEIVVNDLKFLTYFELLYNSTFIAIGTNRVCANPCWNCSSLLSICVPLSSLCRSAAVIGTLCPGGADQCKTSFVIGLPESIC